MIRTLRLASAVLCTLLLAAAPRAAELVPANAPGSTLADLDADFGRLRALAAAMEGMEDEMSRLQLGFQLNQRGHYTADEHDRIERLLFRFLVCRESLWELINRYRDYETLYTDPVPRTKAFLIAYDAALHLAEKSALVVTTFIDEEKVVKKLNEPFYRMDIPAGTYNRLFEALTKPENLRALKAAHTLFAAECADPASDLSRLLAADPAYAELQLEIARLHRNADLRIEYLLLKTSVLLPEVRNQLRHSMIAEFASAAKKTAGGGLAAAKGMLFVNVSRLRSPLAVNLTFSPEDLAGMKKLMRPGDVVLTFSDGYMSNIFLPGKFKHGLTYVGSPAERRAAGLDPAADPELPAPRRDKLARDVAVGALPDGAEADLIEAVAEGVIFNSLSEITHEHLARLVVLRPKLDAAQRARALSTVFLLLGNGYDFDFDFVDGSRQCCTEVVYRALQGNGASFTLTPRAGVLTLAADDIIQHHLKAADASPFEFVLLAEDDAATPGDRPALRTGEAGARRLAALMAE